MITQVLSMVPLVQSGDVSDVIHAMPVPQADGTQFREDLPNGLHIPTARDKFGLMVPTASALMTKVRAPTEIRMNEVAVTGRHASSVNASIQSWTWTRRDSEEKGLRQRAFGSPDQREPERASLMVSARSVRTRFRPRNEIFAWNPRRPVRPGPSGKLIPVRRRVNNFGDLLGPMMVAWSREQRGLTDAAPLGKWQLMSVGSVMHFARDGAVIWGTGVNGKIGLDELHFSRLDVRAVRGPLTAQVLKSLRIDVPAVYGDPGLLAAKVFPHLGRQSGTQARFRVAVVQSLNDRATHEVIGKRDIMIDPRDSVERVLWAIANSEFVISSSLHGLVVADSYGVPSRMLMPENEHRFKYDDYYLGTGRSKVHPATSIEHALELGGEPAAQWDPQPLIDAFPSDLWTPRA